MKQIRVSSIGGTDVLEQVDAAKPQPQSGQALVRLQVIGVNYIDIYHRIGLYKLPLPFVPGTEGAGVVEAVGDGVTEVKVGERVVWAMVPGAYAEYAVVPAAKLVPIPDDVDSRTAAAILLQGLTAHYLATDTYPLREGKSALIHAAAGGTGRLLVQLAKHRGAYVIGTASTPKLNVVRGDGADEVIDYTQSDFKTEVMRITNGRGVDVVYDAVGKTTFEGSVESLARRGVLALFGQASGPVGLFDPSRLGRNSTHLTRPGLSDYIATRQELLWRASEIFELVSRGVLKVSIDRELPLSDAAIAHQLLEGRSTTGKLLLIP